LKKEAIPVLLNVRDFLQANETIRMEIRGHTDNEGDERYNLELSQRRAERVRQFLVKNGVAESRLDVLGMGESVPLLPNDNEAARARNRRIEFVVK
jgi:outer membrane protein OmpA-like peptidoglycan-associated protein